MNVDSATHRFVQWLAQWIPLTLAGHRVKVGDPFRVRKAAQNDLSPVNIAETTGAGNVHIISVVPSLDSPVCEQQTHRLSERNTGSSKMVGLITVTADTPFAQQGFNEAAKIAPVTCLSDYRRGEFRNTHGLFLEGPHMLTRAFRVVDNMNTIRSLQITPELTTLSDMEESVRSARRWMTERSGETDYGKS